MRKRMGLLIKTEKNYIKANIKYNKDQQHNPKLI